MASQAQTALKSRSISDAVEDSANQLLCFWLFEDMRRVRRYIPKIEFQTLEQYTGFTSIQLDEFRSGICDRYNELIKGIQEPSLNMAKLRRIMQEAVQICRDKSQLSRSE
jgi:hypothetical protein